MNLKTVDELLIEGKVLIQLPKDCDLNHLCGLVIRLAETNGFFLLDRRLKFTPSLVMEFLHGTLHPEYCKPTLIDRATSYLYQIFHLKENNSKQTPFLVAYCRTLKTIIDAVPIRMVIKLNPKTNEFFEIEVTLYPALYQKIKQNFIEINDVDFDYIAPELLPNGSRFFEILSSGMMGRIIEKPHFAGIRAKRQIFISHSQKDGELKDFINTAISTTHVKAIYEEYEQLSWRNYKKKNNF